MKAPIGVLKRMFKMHYSYEEFQYDLEEMIESRSKDLKEFQEQYPEYTQKFHEKVRKVYRDFFKC